MFLNNAIYKFINNEVDASLNKRGAELKKSGEITVDLVFETAPLLMKSGKYEETSFCLILITIVKDKLVKSDFKRLESWFLRQTVSALTLRPANSVLRYSQTLARLTMGRMPSRSASQQMMMFAWMFSRMPK